MRIINASVYLTLQEVALLLNISALTLKRYTLRRKMWARKLGKKLGNVVGSKFLLQQFDKRYMTNKLPGYYYLVTLIRSINKMIY